MKISVVVPAHNEEKHIVSCLESLTNQTRQPDEIIVVSNSSTDRTEEIVKSYPKVTLLSLDVKGIIPARNKGFDLATGDIIARCDADTILPKDWVKKIEDSFLNNQSAVALSMPVLVNDIKFGDRFLFLFYLYMLIPRLTMGHYPVVGPSMAVKKEAWDKIKSELCTDAVKVHEDIDISFHIKKLGNIIHDRSNLALTSGRRIKYNLWSFFGEYTLRFFKMLYTHRHLA
ncbi:MAG: glycosyltransferase family 2 protein [Patescibacteria group bacterium]